MSFDPMMLIGASGAGFGPLVSYMGGKKQIQAQQDINSQNIEEARRVMQQQREWALSDWDKVNSYNSPEQQMQRYLDAGLNPNLIYGNAANSPAAMVKSPTQAAGRAEASGILEGIGTISQGFTGAAQQAMNMYFANKQLENDTNLKNAQIINLSAQSDKTNLDAKLTKERWDELVMQPMFNRLEKQASISLKDQQRFGLPTGKLAQDRFKKGTESIEENIKYIKEKSHLANQEGKLKQSDIDTMERLSASPAGIKMIMELLRMILK